MSNVITENGGPVDNLKTENENESDEIEFILTDIGGSFGKFQILHYCLYAIPMFISGIIALSFVFSAANLDYR